MTIRESQTPFSFDRQRTGPEQLVGLGIYLTICLGFVFISGLNREFLSTLYAIILGLGMWALWRRHSLRVLKLELSVFLAQFIFQSFWGMSLYIIHQSLLVLVALLLLSSNTLLATLLFWKKERLSGILYLFPLLWVIYLTFVNMISCISNP